MLEQFPQLIREHWHNRNFQAPTPIQEQVFTSWKENNHLLAISPTGTGKSLAYLLPILTSIQSGQGLQALVFAPSQELVQQISEVAKEWGALLDINCQALMGGANVRRQIDRLKEKPELIIASPGRFKELLNQSSKLKVHQVKWIVYDEADYLFQAEGQQGPVIHEIERHLMRDVTYAWFSATCSLDLEEYLANRSQEITRLEVSQEESPLHIQHIMIECRDRQKVDRLVRLAQVGDMKAIIFFEQINELERVAAKLNYEGLPVSVLHSQISNSERQIGLQFFTQGKTQYLLTTDLASRGIDIEDVPYIIHFNRVREVNTYLHRSGRTGRMGKSGYVISLVNQQEARDLQDLLKGHDIHLEFRYLYARQLVEQMPERDESVGLSNIRQNQKLSNSRPNSAKKSLGPSKKSTPKNKKKRLKDKGKPRRLKETRDQDTKES